MKNYFEFDGKITACADPKIQNNTAEKFWKSFCLDDGELTFTDGEKNTFRLGTTPLPRLPEGKEYALLVDENGAAVVGENYNGLMRGVLSLMMKVEQSEDRFRMEAVEEVSNYRLRNRMIHICVFPENDYYFVQKLIRLCGLCQYTHIVIEFWGMLQFDCLKELAWPHAFTKEQAKELIREAREMGMEPIPMFNQLGHASASRIRSGKHVVLDQNHRLQYLFTPDGWAWDIHSEKVADLHKKVRAELYELFGEGEYMHVGCDEAYYYTNCDEKRAGMPAYLARLTREVEKEGRRPMVWMDMLLERNKYPNCTATCAPEDVKPLIESLSPSTVMVDWQYRVYEKPIPTMLDLKKTGYDVIGAPWLEKKNYEAMLDTVTENDMFGFMLTTWHTLNWQMSGILDCAKQMGAVTFPWSAHSRPNSQTAALMRRVSWEGNSYRDCGWVTNQIELDIGMVH